MSKQLQNEFTAIKREPCVLTRQSAPYSQAWLDTWEVKRTELDDWSFPFMVEAIKLAMSMLFRNELQKYNWRLARIDYPLQSQYNSQKWSHRVLLWDPNNGAQDEGFGWRCMAEIRTSVECSIHLHVEHIRIISLVTNLLNMWFFECSN